MSNFGSPGFEPLPGVEVERGLLRNNGFTFSLIKLEYIYTNLKHKNRKQSTENKKIGNNPKIRRLQQK